MLLLTKSSTKEYLGVLLVCIGKAGTPSIGCWGGRFLIKTNVSKSSSGATCGSSGTSAKGCRPVVGATADSASSAKYKQVIIMGKRKAQGRKINRIYKIK